MLFKWLVRQMQESSPPETIETVFVQFKQSSDFSIYEHNQHSVPYIVSYFSTMIDPQRLHRDVLPFVNDFIDLGLHQLVSKLPIDDVTVTSDPKTIKEKALQGYIILQVKSNRSECMLLKARVNFERDVTVPEMEFTVTGPQEAFVESLDTNINLIRKRIPIEQLKIKSLDVGTISKTKVAVMYVDHIANAENVQTMIQRLGNLEFDQALDSTIIAQMIADNNMAMFPQFINTERPDRVAAALSEGKVVFFCDGSPEAVLGPTTLIEFFSSLEDYYLPWHISSIIRFLRFISVGFSVLATPIYVAVLTFHYELIPRDLLATIMSSRSNIPFPPIIEALFLEFTIELLREAGARLPTKVGQTIGIVGGIVIGQASVEAGLTSNVLLIIVALSALASFTTPVYQMSNTIRLLRFPFILIAAFLGGVGIVLCLVFTLAHLLSLKSLGRPYLEPIYPLRVADWKDAFIRMPFNFLQTRPVFLRTKARSRFSFKKIVEHKDIDE
ncbi:spore germination protein [Bacillus alkalicellulosilyticus]|uniref:spore germination protein n=1 Tax=Alkalihalobacterium alkalicellulosilyticum TaxID=1912214 RepID=UPI0009984D76|nr:spore germination protein [Bacillus alkalicellulosilyticus]